MHGMPFAMQLQILARLEALVAHVARPVQGGRVQRTVLIEDARLRERLAALRTRVGALLPMEDAHVSVEVAAIRVGLVALGARVLDAVLVVDGLVVLEVVALAEPFLAGRTLEALFAVRLFVLVERSNGGQVNGAGVALEAVRIGDEW